MSITLFSWGYYGWGNHTDRLVEAVDAVEESRGFQPPVFVDIRIRRSVRAMGFNGSRFEKLLGLERHRWMPSLGNKRIVSGKGPFIQIAEPETANELLQLAVDCSKERRRVIFFCSCDWPRWEGEVNCHRTCVARLLLEAAKSRRVPVHIQEWPGGEPEQITLDVPPTTMKAIRDGRKNIPVGTRLNPTLAGLPWCSIATFRAGREECHRIVGPLGRFDDEWCLPVASWFLEGEKDLEETSERALEVRREMGLNPVTLSDSI